jgi:hypothetical protein
MRGYRMGHSVLPISFFGTFLEVTITAFTRLIAEVDQNGFEIAMSFGLQNITEGTASEANTRANHISNR